MTGDEFVAALDVLGFKRTDNGTGPKGVGIKGLARFLRANHKGRISRMQSRGVPVEIAMLLRLMHETGYSPEQVEAIAPIVPPPTKQV